MELVNLNKQTLTENAIRGELAANIANPPIQSALVCFSHLRWNFVYQRPQHLMSRFARYYTILYVEEPLYSDCRQAFLNVSCAQTNVYIIVPHIPKSLISDNKQAQTLLLNQLISEKNLKVAWLWYFSPMSIQWTKHFQAQVTVYDCMDELSAFNDAPAELVDNERELMARADLIFTGGISLYQAKRHLHNAVFPFPSSVDTNHFAKARQRQKDPDDQLAIPHPRLGFFGVVDERFDLCLLEGLASTRPEWNFIIIGPVVKIDPATLPRLKNIHYLGMKEYRQLPSYLAGWDVALLPFAVNRATRYISPTKTPEYLAGGKPVVASQIADVIHNYKDNNLVYIADSNNLAKFVHSIELALQSSLNPQQIHKEADKFLRNISWDNTFSAMHELMLSVQSKKEVA